VDTRGEHAEHEPNNGVWGQSPQWGPEAEPLVSVSGGQSLPEAENFLAFGAQRKQQICFILHILQTL